MEAESDESRAEIESQHLGWGPIRGKEELSDEDMLLIGGLLPAPHLCL